MAYFADLKKSMKDLVCTQHDIDLYVNPFRMYCIVVVSWIVASAIAITVL